MCWKVVMKNLEQHENTYLRPSNVFIVNFELL